MARAEREGLHRGVGDGVSPCDPHAGIREHPRHVARPPFHDLASLATPVHVGREAPAQHHFEAEFKRVPVLAFADDEVAGVEPADHAAGRNPGKLGLGHPPQGTVLQKPLHDVVGRGLHVHVGSSLKPGPVGPAPSGSLRPLFPRWAAEVPPKGRTKRQAPALSGRGCSGMRALRWLPSPAARRSRSLAGGIRRGGRSRRKSLRKGRRRADPPGPPLRHSASAFGFAWLECPFTETCSVPRIVRAREHLASASPWLAARPAGTLRCS